jgi:hypothetical protein
MDPLMPHQEQSAKKHPQRLRPPTLAPETCRSSELTDPSYRARPKLLSTITTRTNNHSTVPTWGLPKTTVSHQPRAHDSDCPRRNDRIDAMYFHYRYASDCRPLTTTETPYFIGNRADSRTAENQRYRDTEPGPNPSLPHNHIRSRTPHRAAARAPSSRRRSASHHPRCGPGVEHCPRGPPRTGTPDGLHRSELRCAPHSKALKNNFFPVGGFSELPSPVTSASTGGGAALRPRLRKLFNTPSAENFPARQWTLRPRPLVSLPSHLRQKKLAGQQVRPPVLPRKVTDMRAQHLTTADELDYLHGGHGTPDRKRRTKRASARRDRRSTRRELRT